MSDSNLTKNEVSADGKKVKKPLFKVVLFSIFLIILGLAFYFFKDSLFSIFNKKVDIEDISTEVSESEKESPFENLVSNSNTVSNNDVVSDVKDPTYYIDLYDEYKMGEMGIRYLFKGFDESTMSLKLMEKNEEGDVEKIFPLSEDFLIVCTVFDISKYGLDFSRLDDMDKYSIAFESSSMTLEEKKNLLSSYPEGSTIALIFTDMNFDSNSKVKKILITNDHGFR